MKESIKITECPRDAMQGINAFIPTALKIGYLNELLKCGFPRLDFGSFVSEKAIPQLKDTSEVLASLDSSPTELLAIVANRRGAEEACRFDRIRFLGFPFSVSATFQQRNANSGIDESFLRVKEIHELCKDHGKTLLVYLSMAFGNPYGDLWSEQVVLDWAGKLAAEGIRHLALADTIGSSTPGSIKSLFSTLLPGLPGVEIGAHLHSTCAKAAEKIQAAYDAGCRHFDVAIHGFGGCPMAAEELTGNLATEDLLDFCEGRNIETGLNSTALEKAYAKSWSVFNAYH